jgi:hypothetical protein
MKKKIVYKIRTIFQLILINKVLIWTKIIISVINPLKNKNKMIVASTYTQETNLNL